MGKVPAVGQFGVNRFFRRGCLVLNFSCLRCQFFPFPWGFVFQSLQVMLLVLLGHLELFLLPNCTVLAKGSECVLTWDTMFCVNFSTGPVHQCAAQVGALQWSVKKGWGSNECPCVCFHSRESLPTGTFQHTLWLQKLCWGFPKSVCCDFCQKIGCTE